QLHPLYHYILFVSRRDSALRYNFSDQVFSFISYERMSSFVKNCCLTSTHRAGVQRTQSFAGVRGTLSGGQCVGAPEKLFFPFRLRRTLLANERTTRKCPLQ